MKLCSVFFFTAVALASGADWCYKKAHCGEHTWGGRCQNRGSEARQTPIDLEYKVATTSASKVLDFSESYYRNYQFEASNNGHTLSITMKDVTTPLTMVGDLTHGINYTFAGVHFHWGSNAFSGSEHTINGRRYAMEAHYVNFKSVYGSLADAVAHQEDPTALAVFAILFEEDDSTGPNEKLQPIVAAISGARYKGQTAVGGNFNMFGLIPDLYKSRKARNTFVVNYKGSLTTPSCDEIVLWNVCTIPAKVSSDQMNQFRTMFAHGHDAPEKEHLVDNYRELQDISGRVPNVYRTTIRMQGNY